MTDAYRMVAVVRPDALRVAGLRAAELEAAGPLAKGPFAKGPLGKGPFAKGDAMSDSEGDAAGADPASVRRCVTLDNVALVLEPAGSDLEEQARAAHGDVMRLWRAGPTLPGGARSVFRGGAEETRRWLTEHLATLQDALDAVDGAGEFLVSIRVRRDGGEASSAAANAASGAASGGPGAAYLKARATAMRSEAAAAADVEGVADALQQALSEALGSAPTRVARYGAAAADVAVLAPMRSGARLSAAIAPFHGAAHAFSATGPWPPYGFAAELTATAGAGAR